MRIRDTKASCGRLALVSCLVAVLSGCGASGAGAPVTIVPTHAAPATATPGTTFVVAVTQLPGPTPRPTPRPSPSPTTPPGVPFLSLAPASGPPSSGTILVRGGHLPHVQALDLVWSPSARSSPVRTTVYTGPHGGLTARFHIPASPPGTYRVSLQQDGYTLVFARYAVRSEAHLTSQTIQTRRGQEVQVLGSGFLAHLNLTLVVYPLDNPSRPVLLGHAAAGRMGSFAFTRPLRGWRPGEYDLRAYSSSAFAAQMAESFFEVAS